VTPEIKINTTQFMSELRKYVDAHIGRESLARVLNRKMIFILRRAKKLTPIADKAAILSFFSTGFRFTKPRKSTTVPRIQYTYNAMGRTGINIVQWKRWKKGEKALTQVEAAVAAKKMIASRLRAVGSLQYGWNKALNTLARTLGEPMRDGGSEGKIKHGKGMAIPAKSSWTPTVIAEYDLKIHSAMQPAFHIDDRLVPAVQQAFDEETRSMQDYFRAQLLKGAGGGPTGLKP
jgi:hypothetical protein